VRQGRSLTAAGPSFPLGLDESGVLQNRIIGLVPPAATRAARERLPGIDLLRIMAAVGIVWFHMNGTPYRQIGYAGLPMFLLIFFSLVTRQSRVRTTLQFVGRRWDRLLKPWLFWSLVYGLCTIAKAACTMDWKPLYEMMSARTFLVGTCLHLWYLPYAFASGLLIHVLNRRTLRINNTVVVCTAMLIGVFTLAASAVSTHSQELPLPLPQWEFGLAALPLGWAIGRSLAAPSHRARAVLLSLISVMTLGVSFILILLGRNSVSVPYSLAVVLVCLAYVWPARGNGFVATVTPLTFGIYLLHPLVISGFRHCLPAEGHFAASLVLTVCISGMVTWGLMQTRLARFV
jgi:peptidoglycan/LPS O-acetylase OafA/YrhL